MSVVFAEMKKLARNLKERIDNMVTYRTHGIVNAVAEQVGLAKIGQIARTCHPYRPCRPYRHPSFLRPPGSTLHLHLGSFESIPKSPDEPCASDE